MKTLLLITLLNITPLQPFVNLLKPSKETVERKRAKEVRKNLASYKKKKR